MIGEISFSCEDGKQLPLLIKYIFTSEKLSVQVHPDDVLGRAHGHPHGKTECWYILDAAPDAAVALGFNTEVDTETVRASALNGSIENMIRWLPARRGDFFYVPAGTFHAIGAGITLLEIQQSLDVTYRLYDYGRPRKLHLAEALQAASVHPYCCSIVKHENADPAQVLVSGEHFSVLRIKGQTARTEELVHRDRWIVPLRGQVSGRGEVAEAGDCMFLAAGEPLEQSADGMMLLAVQGSL